MHTPCLSIPFTIDPRILKLISAGKSHIDVLPAIGLWMFAFCLQGMTPRHHGTINV